MELRELPSRLTPPVVAAGIGNSLRGDDGAGPEAVHRLKMLHSRAAEEGLYLLDTGEIPENYLGKIIDYIPRTIIFIDAVDFGGNPGELKIVEFDYIKNEGLTTHNASLRLTIEFLKRHTQAVIIFLGIQPSNIQFGSPLSEPVLAALDTIVAIFSHLPVQEGSGG